MAMTNCEISLPLNITISVGNVSFQLTPSTDNVERTPPMKSFASMHSPQSSPCRALGKRSKRRSAQALSYNSGSGNTAHHNPLPQDRMPKSPILTISHESGRVNAPVNGAISSLPHPVKGENLSSPRSPTQQYILRRIRSMKNKLEFQDRRNSAPAFRKIDTCLGASFNGVSYFSESSPQCTNYYIDLDSFSGTLQIMANNDSNACSGRRSVVENRQENHDNSVAHIQSSLERASEIHDKISQSHLSRLSNLSRLEVGINEVGYNYDEKLGVDIKGTSRSPSIEVVVTDSVSSFERSQLDYLETLEIPIDLSESGKKSPLKKSVQFSLNVSNIDSSVDTKQSEKNNMDSSNGLLRPSICVNSTKAKTGQSFPEKSVELMEESSVNGNSKSRGFFASPPSTFSSPTKILYSAGKSLNYAIETSSALARSSKQVLKQISSAGSDAYQVLGSPSSLNKQRTKSVRSSIFSSLHSNGSFINDYNDSTGTELHHACASSDLIRIQNLLQDGDVDDLKATDSQSKYPIHLFTENQNLITEYPIECEEIVFDMIRLMGPDMAVQALYPLSGWNPFVGVVGRWIDGLHEGMVSRSGHPMATPISRLFYEFSGLEPTEEKRNDFHKSLNYSVDDDEKVAASVNVNDREKSFFIPDTVTIHEHVKWAIRVLSRLIDEFTENTREAILTNITSTVPLFLKCVFLINDADEMSLLTETTLVKHVILDKRSVNLWLIAMLTTRRETKLRAVAFLKLLSRLTLNDLAANSQYRDRYSDKEIERFIHLRRDTFNAVYVMPGIFPAVLGLGGKSIENLSTTLVMRYITAMTIRKEKVFFRLVCDFFFAIFLLMGFRMQIEFGLVYDSVDGPSDYSDRRYFSMSTSCIACYFLVKDFMTLLSLYLTSTQLAKRYLTSVFNIIDIASVAMLLGIGFELNDGDSQEMKSWTASLTIILLWLKLLGAFKILNSSFALFLYAVHEVIKDIKWFLVFLFAITFMFSDAARAVVSARGDCEIVNDDIPSEFCSDDYFAINTRMYAVLVGDVDLASFQSSGAMTLVFIFFSFFCIIILLNILIAIIIDSYEGSKDRSREIVGRAQIEYAAHLVARNQFLTPKDISDFHVASYVPHNLRRLLKLCFVFVYAIALMAFEYGFIGAIIYLNLNMIDDKMMTSLIIAFVVVGSVFNIYAISFAVITLYSWYDSHKTSHERVLGFHGVLGFNIDKMLDLSDDVIDQDVFTFVKGT